MIKQNEEINQNLPSLVDVENTNRQTLKLGTAATDITPRLDDPLAGYYYDRTADGVHDNLFVKAMVLDDGMTQLVLVVCDLGQVEKETVEKVYQLIQEKLTIPPEQIIISATHTHTGPKCTDEYLKLLPYKITDCVTIAKNRLSKVGIGVNVGQEAGLSYNRRFWMKDGSVVTNPGFLNPDVVRPVGPIDPMVGILYFEEPNGKAEATFVNFALHLDTIGGTLISADYPAFLSQILHKVKGEHMMSIFTQGCCGDINHWDVQQPGSQRGFETSRGIGTVLAGEVIKNYPRMEFPANITLRALSRKVALPIQKFIQEQVDEARKVWATPNPYEVEIILERVYAYKILRCDERQGQPVEEEIKVFSIGDEIALVALPGEIFCQLGLTIKEKSPFKYTFIIELAYDYPGYIPTKEAFEQSKDKGYSGYECASSIFAPGAGELVVDVALELLNKLKK